LRQTARKGDKPWVDKKTTKKNCEFLRLNVYNSVFGEISLWNHRAIRNKKGWRELLIDKDLDESL